MRYVLASLCALIGASISTSGFCETDEADLSQAWNHTLQAYPLSYILAEGYTYRELNDCSVNYYFSAKNRINTYARLSSMLDEGVSEEEKDKTNQIIKSGFPNVLDVMSLSGVFRAAAVVKFDKNPEKARDYLVLSPFQNRIFDEITNEGDFKGVLESRIHECGLIYDAAVLDLSKKMKASQK